jgi:hypothetical protein
LLVATRMKTVNRPERTTAELIDLINKRREDWWPEHFLLSIGRSAEHDWIAIGDFGANRVNGNLRADFAHSVDQVVSQLRLSNAWIGH